MEIENIISKEALHESMVKCSKGVRWKGTVSYWRHHWIEEVPKLSEQLHDGTYRERKPKFFTITSPKRREIMSIHFRDRVYQRSLNDVAIMPQVSRCFIPENFACQKDKGTDAARKCLKRFLHEFHNVHGMDGYVLKIDIKGYYPNMHHNFAERMLAEYVDKETHVLAKQVLARLPGEIGYNPGSQIVQIVGITALDRIDRIIKDRLKIAHYIRYMDDFVLIHHSKDYLSYCLCVIKEELARQGMETHGKKTFIRSVARPIRFLGFDYHLKESGAIVIFAAPEKIKYERKKILRMMALYRKGERTKREIDRHFKAFKASVRFGNTHMLIRRMNRWYSGLWEGVQNGVDNQKIQDGNRRAQGHRECAGRE